MSDLVIKCGKKMTVGDEKWYEEMGVIIKWKTDLCIRTVRRGAMAMSDTNSNIILLFVAKKYQWHTH